MQLLRGQRLDEAREGGQVDMLRDTSALLLFTSLRIHSNSLSSDRLSSFLSHPPSSGSPIRSCRSARRTFASSSCGSLRACEPSSGAWSIRPQCLMRVLMKSQRWKERE